MATKNRKAQSNSLGKQREVLIASFDDIKPPEHMDLEDKYRVYFDNVIAEFAKSEWTNHQLEIACMLARTICDLKEQQITLASEGYIAVRENGTTVENPRARVVKSLTGDILSFRRSLALHARARSGEARDIAKKKSQLLSAESNELDDLIARPH